MQSNQEMNPELAARLLRVGKIFRLKGSFFAYHEICQGNVNHTYKVDYIMDEDGMAKTKSYLMQSVNTYAFKNPTELMQNIDKVTEYIRAARPGQTTLHFHHTEDRKNYYVEGDEFWRVCNFVPSITFDKCEELSVIRNTGAAFGDFQTMLSDFDASRLFYTIPDFHNTRKRYNDLIEGIKEDPMGRVKEVREEIDYLLSVQDIACKLTDMFNEGKLPLRVTHNDTKINNVLFDAETKKALVVIDLDTVMPGLVGHDFGDAVRFAANFVEEDCKDADKAGVDLNVFWAFTEGFLEKTAKALTKEEIDTLALSAFSIACELASRFLLDYINGDKYFKISYEGHNLVRARCQIALAKDMLDKMGAMDGIVQGCYKKYCN